MLDFKKDVFQFAVLFCGVLFALRYVLKDLMDLLEPTADFLEKAIEQYRRIRNK